jgi:hypothetical protein
MSAISSRNVSPSIYLTDLITIDQTRDKRRIGSAIERYLNSHPDENCATIERAFRANRCWSHLYAKEMVDSFIPTLRREPRKYILCISTEDPELAKREVLMTSGDVETNYMRLLDTGCTFVDAFIPVRILVPVVGSRLPLGDGSLAERRPNSDCVSKVCSLIKGKLPTRLI